MDTTKKEGSQQKIRIDTAYHAVIMIPTIDQTRIAEEMKTISEEFGECRDYTCFHIEPRKKGNESCVLISALFIGCLPPSSLINSLRKKKANQIISLGITCRSIGNKFCGTHVDNLKNKLVDNENIPLASLQRDLPFISICIGNEAVDTFFKKLYKTLGKDRRGKTRLERLADIDRINELVIETLKEVKDWLESVHLNPSSEKYPFPQRSNIIFTEAQAKKLRELLIKLLDGLDNVKIGTEKLNDTWEWGRRPNSSGERKSMSKLIQAISQQVNSRVLYGCKQKTDSDSNAGKSKFCESFDELLNLLISKKSHDSNAYIVMKTLATFTFSCIKCDIFSEFINFRELCLLFRSRINRINLGLAAFFRTSFYVLA
jgi:hypothetical protein